MSLPAAQQRILDGIAETLRLTEPRLTVMFAIFTRLAKNEPPPCRERITIRRRGLAWRRLLIVSQLAIAVIALLALTYVTSHGAAGCGEVQQPHADAGYAPRLPACLAPGPSGFHLAGK